MITLSSDFGSPYPAAMKGVLCSRTEARLVDVAHDFPRHDVRTAAFWLREVLPYFPPAVHLVVVDPGVGTDRAGLVLRAGEYALVGPDNGVLVPAARRLRGADGTIEAHAITIEEPASTTFHGRDVFAPAAAAVHDAGVAGLGSVERLEPAGDYRDLRFPEPTLGDGAATGEVLVVDGFGNAVTNVPGEVLRGLEGREIVVDGGTAPVARAYDVVDEGERLVTVGSHGLVELAANRGRGDEAFGTGPGRRVRLAWERG